MTKSLGDIQSDLTKLVNDLVAADQKVTQDNVAVAADQTAIIAAQQQLATDQAVQATDVQDYDAKLQALKDYVNNLKNL